MTFRRKKTASDYQDGRQSSIKEWLERLLSIPLGRCLPEIALCILLCCMLTGHVVLRMEQKEQYRQDTFEVYMQEYGQSVQEREAEDPQLQTAAVTPPLSDSAAVSDEDDTEALAETSADVPVAPSVQLYATPSGKRYHYDPACPGKNGQEITWDEASQRGLTPCKKCAK